MTLFLGNSASFHLTAWIKLYHHLGQSAPELATIHRIAAVDKRFSRMTRVFLRPKILSYFLLGFRLRFSHAPFVHAHGASGYGLAAWLSGKPYIATVYGSEVLAQHSFFFRLMMRIILQHARIVTVTSKMTRAKLICEFKVSPSKIRCFHTGIDTAIIDSIRTGAHKEQARDRIRVLSMRNTAKHYRTKDIIESCIALARNGYAIDLTIPLGNGDIQYFRKLKEDYPIPWITFIEKRLDNSEMLELMSHSTVCVSYPTSDQMSTTILEALCLGRPVVMNFLDAYSDLIDATGESRGLYIAHSDDLASTLRCALEDTPHENAIDIVKNQYGIGHAAQYLREILEIFDDRNRPSPC